eukprot:m.5039 g.5039  ORF g.5039 m.5039 type:complete len:306 (+) comp4105_c0_seq1:176-1093(+)
MDRLAQLQKLASETPTEQEEVASQDDVAVTIEEEVEPAPVKDENFMKDFFDKINKIRETVNIIEEKIDIVASKHTELLMEPNSSKGAVINQHLHAQMNAIQDLSKGVKTSLKRIEKENKDAQKSGMFNDGTMSTELRIRQMQHASVTKKFIKVMTKYNDVQAENKKKYTEVVRRQCHVYDGDMSEDDIQKVIEEGTTGLFTGRVEDAENSLNKIKDRHDDLVALEASLNELHEMFMDMAILVSEQGEMIDKIEHMVDQSHDYVREGVKQVKKAHQIQKKVRHKKICCLFWLCLLIVLIIILAIVL